MATPVELSESDLAKPLREVLRDAALQAFRELGPVEFLKANPDLLGRVLVKAITPEPILAPVAPQEPWPSWLTARRLAYQESAPVAEDIQIKNLD